MIECILNCPIYEGNKKALLKYSKEEIEDLYEEMKKAMEEYYEEKYM